jgi:flagellar hook protein FlgE
LAAALAKFDRAVESAVAAADGGNGDVAKSAAELSMAAIGVQANATATKSADEMLGTLLDIKI